AANITQGSSYVASIFHNRGDGVFSSDIRAIGTYPKAWPEALLAADINCDGKLDLAIASTGSDDVWVLINEAKAPSSTDFNKNGVPDECDHTAFRRGDSNIDA